MARVFVKCGDDFVMKYDLCKNVRSFQKWAVIFSILAGVGVLALCFGNDVSRGPELYSRLMVSACLFFVMLSSLAAMCCGISWSLEGGRLVSRTRTWIVRIAFYCLFLLGPTLLSWGHAFYVKAKLHDQEIARTISVEGRACNPYVICHTFCAALGMISIGGWLLWVWCAMVCKSTQYAVTLYRRHYNCQDHADALRNKYNELIRNKKIRCECGLSAKKQGIHK